MKTYGKAMVDLVIQLECSRGRNDLPDVGLPFRVSRVGGRVRTMDPKDPELWDSESKFYTICQLRRLHRLLGINASILKGSHETGSMLGHLHRR